MDMLPCVPRRRPPTSWEPPLDHMGRRYIDVHQLEAEYRIAAITLEKWAAKGVTPQGLPLQGIRHKNTAFVDEAHFKALNDRRFYRVSDGQLVQSVRIGVTPDQTGYLDGFSAESAFNLNQGTLGRWCNKATKGELVFGVRLDVIRDSLHGGMYFVSEKSLRALFDPGTKGGKPVRLPGR